MGKRSNSSGNIILITLAALSLITGAIGVYFLYQTDADRLQNLDKVPEDKTPEMVIVESVLEPEVEVIEQEYTDTDSQPVAGHIDDVLHDLGAGIHNYCFAHLNDAQQNLYAEIYQTLMTFGSDMPVSTLDPDEIEHAFSCVMLDHPEIFYVTGYTLTKYTRGSSLEKITFTGKYTMNESDAKSCMNKVEEIADECIANAPEGGDYERIKYVYEWLIKRCDYELNASNNQNILSVFLSRKTVCQGYAKAAQYLLNKMGMFCILCEGEAMGREAHVWNIVKADGEYYYLDVTWGDASYTLNSSDSDQLTPPDINYEYMCVPFSEIAGTHTIKETVTLPVCNSMDDNYYVHEGLYFDTVSERRLEQVFSDAYQKGQETVTIKCADGDSFDAMERYLIDNEHIFDYLSGNTKVNYLKMEDRRYFLFYLK